MQSKFNFYDFVGYFIPGAIVIALLYWFCVGFFALSLPVEVKSVGESILFLGASYILGHIVQAYASMFEGQKIQKWGGLFSDQFLRDDNNFYTKEYKDGIKDSICQTFALSCDLDSDNREIKAKRSQETFNLCYTLISQENMATHPEIFLGLNSLHRGILTAFHLGVVVSGIITAKHLVLWLIPSLSSNPNTFFHFDDVQLGLGAFSLILFLVSIPLLEYRYKNFSQHFVNSVYRGFYTWYRKKQYKSEAK